MARKPKQKQTPSTLLAALKFIEPASREIGAINQTHCALGGNWAVAFDGVTALASPIDSDIVAYPHTKKFIAALSRCDADTLQITQLDESRLAIKSGRFQSYVPCISPGLFQILPPDPPLCPIDEKVVKSLEVVGKIAKENAPRMVAAAVLLRYGSAVSTDGVIMFEHWHACSIPGDCVIPKSFITEITKIAKKPTHIGRSESSMTIYFEDKSWIRTQLYNEPYPNADRILETKSNTQPIPKDFWEGLEKISGPDANEVFLSSKSLRTHYEKEIGSSFEIEGLPENRRFNLNYLRMFEPYATQVDFSTDDNRMAMFFGDNFRGVLMCIRMPQPAKIGGNLDGDEVPF